MERKVRGAGRSPLVQAWEVEVQAGSCGGRGGGRPGPPSSVPPPPPPSAQLNCEIPKAQPVRGAPPPGETGKCTLPHPNRFLQTFVVPVPNFYVCLATCPVKGVI